ncbi:uncharacterized protein LOC118216973 [Anguilla anguilla]|uniref:uncharacterized protein LOC118216973 n=1 Tax=Anguilla anguilla TaxID=7936 RepID=UPI0015A76F03|nr:uncharacterized protein LOC118216973 [Anguilla anguilla]
MAAKPLIPEDDLCCSICCDIFKEPVLLKCSHSFCKICLQQYWEEKSSRECPVCRRNASMEDPPVNLALKNIVESYLMQKSIREAAGKSDDHCSLHGEKRLFFCEHDQEPLCVVCQTSKKHRNHPVCPVEEAALDLKEELKPALNLIKEKLKRFTEVERECKKAAEHIRRQARHTDRQIKAEFKKLRQFLREEEAVRLALLRVEEEQKSQIMKEKTENITGHISTLTDKITAIEKAMDTEDISFLKSYKNIKERAQCTLQDPELLSGALIDVAKHLGNLKFRAWEKMREMVQYTPVVLDPNTVHTCLSLSDDLTTVRLTGTDQKYPDNPERFKPCGCVLGYEGFTSGKHSWDVKVGNKSAWDIGVMKESISRKGAISCNPKKGFWVLTLRNGDKYGATGGAGLTLKRKPQSIRVQLEYDRGEVSFFDSSDMSLIYTFKDTFTERVFPFFSPCLKEDGRNEGPLQICPVKVSVTLCPDGGDYCPPVEWPQFLCKMALINWALRSIVETYLKQKTTDCSLHGEKLLLFCEHDKEPLCLVCQTSKKHRNHPVCPVEEAVLALKEELKPALNLIKEKLKRFTEVEQECKKTAEHIRSQAQHTESQIKAEFEKLHQFLREEEEARLAALRDEEEQKSQTMKEKIKNITGHISTLTDKITAIEKAMGTEDTSVLQSYKNIKERAQCTLQDPELLSGALIDVAKHLGNLKFRVWEKMLEMVQYSEYLGQPVKLCFLHVFNEHTDLKKQAGALQSAKLSVLYLYGARCPAKVLLNIFPLEISAPVFLDPNTAPPFLSLSDDLTTVRHTGTYQKYPANPERFNSCVSVMGSEGFTSGIHSWEVKVGNKLEWTIGVMKESISRKGDIPCIPKRGFWVLTLKNGDMYRASGVTDLRLKRKPQSIRAQLDYDRGEVSFFDSSDMSLIYTFKDTFTERVFPYFSPGLKRDKNEEPLHICPVKVSITVMSSQ